MRKSYWMILLVCLAFVFVHPVSAQMYTGAKVGYVMTTDSDYSENGEDLGDVEWDGGFGFGLFLGTALDQFRVEGEFEYRSADVEEEDSEDTTLKTMSLLANGYYDFTLESPLKPYVGAGLGFARHDVEDSDDTVFAYQLSLGAAWSVSENVDLDFGYRYFATADMEGSYVDEGTTVNTEVSYATHNLTLGLRYKF